MMTRGATPASTLWFPNPCILPIEDTAPYKGPNLMRTVLPEGWQPVLSEYCLQAGAAIVS